MAANDFKGIGNVPEFESLWGGKGGHPRWNPMKNSKMVCECGHADDEAQFALDLCGVPMQPGRYHCKRCGAKWESTPRNRVYVIHASEQEDEAC